MLKEYFIKASHVDPNQPLIRIHANDTVELDLSKPYYTIVSTAKQQMCGSQSTQNSIKDFTIDFMIEVPKDTEK
jgi:hypothetical protein